MLELRTLRLLGTRDNHYTMVTGCSRFCVGSICWMRIFSGVFFKALTSNGLLTTTTFRIIPDRPDYKEGLVKDSNLIVQTRMLGFPLGWVFLSFDFSYRCWWSSPSVQKWKFWFFVTTPVCIVVFVRVSTGDNYYYTRVELFRQWCTLNAFRLLRCPFCGLFSSLLIQKVCSE